LSELCLDTNERLFVLTNERSFASQAHDLFGFLGG
jgi:hypothetical protein